MRGALPTAGARPRSVWSRSTAVEDPSQGNAALDCGLSGKMAPALANRKVCCERTYSKS